MSYYTARLRPYPRTPAEKRAETLQRKVENTICERLRECRTPEDTVRVFEELKATPLQKSSAFWELDTRSALTPNHGLLRAARNTPELGRRLFDTFK